MITEEQRQNRRKYLGSSDAPAIVGVNPWRNAADVYWDKIKPPTENEARPTNEAMKLGKFLERAVLDWFSHETKKEILRDQERVHSNEIMAANFDALVVTGDGAHLEAVEAKTAGLLAPFDRDEWGEVGTDEVPDHVIIQCQHQMAVLPAVQVVWVPALLGNVGFCLYRIERNDVLIKSLEEIEVNFWKNHVEQRIVPPDNLPTINTIKRIQRVPAKTVSIADELIQKWLDAKEVASAADKTKEEAQRAVLAALGDAEAGDCSFGRLTYLEQSRKEQVIPASTFRVARFKKNKKEAA